MGGGAMKVCAFAGGVGGAKLAAGGEGAPPAGGGAGGERAAGLQGALPPGDLTVVVNTADDFDLWALRICPDLDTVMYTLAGISNPETGWGLAGEAFEAPDKLDRYGG